MSCGCERYEREWGQYREEYGEEIARPVFNAQCRAADRVLEDVTTGVDGVCKLRQCPPTDEYWQGVVRDALLELVHVMVKINAAADASSGIVHNADGTVQSGVVKSRSSGSESITYATPGDSVYAVAARDSSARSALLRDRARERLRYVPDCNGVNMTYMGPYPFPDALKR